LIKYLEYSSVIYTSSSSLTLNPTDRRLLCLVEPYIVFGNVANFGNGTSGPPSDYMTTGCGFVFYRWFDNTGYSCTKTGVPALSSLLTTSEVTRVEIVYMMSLSLSNRSYQIGNSFGSGFDTWSCDYKKLREDRNWHDLVESVRPQRPHLNLCLPLYMKINCYVRMHYEERRH
jgi:hypothetical protein